MIVQTVISCPHCAGGARNASCCVCKGTRRSVASADHFNWLWEYAGCDCDTCEAALMIRRAFRERPMPPAPPRPSFRPRPAGITDRRHKALMDVSAYVMANLNRAGEPK